jgi:hypothetical protein
MQNEIAGTSAFQIEWICPSFIPFADNLTSANPSCTCNPRYRGEVALNDRADVIGIGPHGRPGRKLHRQDIGVVTDEVHIEQWIEGCADSVGLLQSCLDRISPLIQAGEHR